MKTRFSNPSVRVLISLTPGLSRVLRRELLAAASAAFPALHEKPLKRFYPMSAEDTRLKPGVNGKPRHHGGTGYERFRIGKSKKHSPQKISIQFQDDTSFAVKMIHKS